MSVGAVGWNAAAHASALEGPRRNESWLGRVDAHQTGRPPGPLAGTAPPLPLPAFQVCTLAAGENWTSADMVDSILSFAVTELANKMTDQYNPEGKDMLERVRAGANADRPCTL